MRQDKRKDVQTETVKTPITTITALFTHYILDQ